MKNFTNNFKQFTSRLSARWLIMALMLLLGTSSAWGWGFKYDDGGSWNTCSSSSFDQTTFYTNPTGSSTTSVYIRMYTGLVKTGFNITQNDGCDGQKLYVNLSGVASTSSNTIVRASARWVTNKGIYSEYTIVIPEGNIYIKPTNGDAVLMTKSTYTYTAELTLSEDAKTFDLYADDPGNSKIENQDGMPSAGKPTSVRLNYTGLTSPYQYVKVTYNLKTNQITFEEMTPPCTPATSITSAELQQNGTIKLEGDFTTCGAKYHGFQWRKSTADWCDDGDESQDFSNYVKIGNTEGGEREVKYFTPKSGVTYVFRTYIYNNGSWIYSSEPKEVSTCVTVEEPNITSNSPICLGSGLTLTLNERQDGVVYKIGNQEIFTEGNTTYSFVPQASGTGSLTVVAIHEQACNGTTNSKEIQYTVNTLPSVPILTTGSTNVCPGTVTLANFKAMAEQNTVVWYSNQECTKEVTTPTVEKGGRYTFYAKSKNASGCFSEGYSTLEVNVYDDPKDFTLTAFPTEICSGADVEISISNKQDGVTYKLGEEIIDEIITVNPTDDTEYTVTAYLNACPTLTRSKITGVITVHPIPGFTVDPTNLSLCKGSTSVTDLTELSHVVVENGDPVWYDAETAGKVVTTGADLENGGTYWVAAENNETGCVNTKRKSFTLKIYDLPKYPDLTKTSAVVCQADETVNLNTLAGVNDVIWYQGEDEVQKPDEISIDEEGIFTYTAKAVNANGCQSATGVDFKLTVNPLPTITSISASNDKPVLFEDVVLTADGVTSGAEVKWYLGNDVTPVATGTTYTVTSENTGEVIVKAKAFLNGCESAEVSHTVNFSAEDCADVTTTVEETVGKIKLLLSKPSWIGSGEKFNCYAWEENTTNTLLGGWPGTELSQKEGSYYVIIVDSNNKNINIILNDGSEQTVDSDVLNANTIYQISATSNENSDNKYTFNSKTNKGTYKESVTTTVPAPITAPAVKTVSFETTPGDGNINFSGQIVKTGCDNSLTYGFEYKEVGAANWTQVVLGRDLDKDAGFTFSDNTIKDLDGKYVVRAFITNDNSTQYGAVTEITVSTIKEPITSVVLTHVKDVNGTAYEDQELENLTYCVGDEVWFELNYVGSTFIPENNVGFKWTTYPGNGLIGAYNGNKYKFTITGSGTIGISLRNEANVDLEGNPTWIESNLLEFNTHPEPTAPYISIDPASGVICQGSSATIKVENPSIDCSYKLVEEQSKADFTPYKSGDLIYKVQKVGKYYVVAQHNACTANEYTSNQVAINQIISTSAKISIEPANAETTPWEPVTITVKPDAGYIYELSYTDNNLAGVNGVRIKQNGDSYTYYIPRPDAWTTGDSNPVRTPINYGIKAQLKVDGEASQCQLNAATATIQLKDEDNENCPK